MTRNLNELQEKYEEEFLNFILQKLNHAGGSLQFQHLSGLLQQLRFEIRDTFGVTKPVLMKFLKARSNIFSISSKGVVKLVNSSTSDNSEFAHEEENQNVDVKKTFLSKIKNGKGYIFKVFAGYAIIKAIRPIQTYIFFTPLEYGAEKDSVFNIDFDLPVRTRVCFNAIHGHSDYEIEYRATKVWRDADSDDEDPHPINEKRTKKRQLTGEGIVKLTSPHLGIISVASKGNETVSFSRTNMKDIKNGDRVEFVAEYDSKGWQAIEIIKKKKDIINQSPQTCNKATDKQNAVHDKIENQWGKIYPYSKSKGAMIKFGKNYSEIADGSSCDFYFYGIKVKSSEIALEFSEGDDVQFDAINSQKSGWKVILVWIGDKPFVSDIDKKILQEIDENFSHRNKNKAPDISAAVSLEKSDLLSNTRKKKKFDINLVDKGLGSNNSTRVRRSRSNSRKMNSLFEECHKNNIVTPKVVSQALSNKDSNYNKNRKKRKDRKSTNKYNQKKVSKVAGIGYVEGNKYLFKDTSSSLSENSDIISEENNELQDPSYCPRKFLKENDSSEFENDSSDFLKDENNKGAPTSDKTFTKRESNIKRFEAIDGAISRVSCKVGFIKTVHLEKEASFVLNTFYLNGESVEDLQITDLSEITSVGEAVKFNYFEIIDDYGEIHDKVTAVWKGPKPNMYEMKPDEFILDNGLHVSIGEVLDYESESEKSSDTTRNANFSGSYDMNLEVESSLNDKSNDGIHECSTVSEKVDEHVSSLIQHERLSEVDVQHEPETLPDIILKKLRTCGFISSERENALNAVQEIIDLVLKNSNIEESFDSSVSRDGAIKSGFATVCSSCAKKEVLNTKDSEAQTIITGAIAADNTACFQK